MKTWPRTTNSFRIAAISICILSVLVGACFLRRSLDSYEGTPTMLLPASVGSFDRRGEYSPVLIDSYAPEIRSLIRFAANASYTRKNDPASDEKFSFVQLSVFICFTSEKAKEFLRLNKEAALNEGNVLKEEGPRKRWLVSGERLLLIPSPEKGTNPSGTNRLYWRNGTVVFMAWTTTKGKIEDAVEFEKSYLY